MYRRKLTNCMTNQDDFSQENEDGSLSRLNRVIQKDTPLNIPIHIDDETRNEQPTRPNLVATQVLSSPAQVEVVAQPSQLKTIKKKRLGWLWAILTIILVCALLPTLFAPVRVTTLILGIDRPPENTWIGRSDTMILTTLKPLSSKVSMLSIPRDLWLNIPGHYQNRINTAHYFAELEVPGSGMEAAKVAVEENFGIDVDYVVRIKFDGFVDIVDAMGGVTINLPKDMAGFSAGRHHFDGTEALKFVRERKSDDDFFRQERGQMFIAAAIKEMLNPIKWPRIPAVAAAVSKSIETDLPVWLWPRIGSGFIYSAATGFDAHTFDRNAITPWVTDEGAQVLLPNWELMNPLIDGLFK